MAELVVVVGTCSGRNVAVVVEAAVGKEKPRAGVEMFLELKLVSHKSLASAAVVVAAAAVAGKMVV